MEDIDYVSYRGHQEHVEIDYLVRLKLNCLADLQNTACGKK